MTDEGTIVGEYVGVKIDHNLLGGSFRIFQPYLLKTKIQAIPGMDNVNAHQIPVTTAITPTNDKNWKERKEAWDYRPVVCMLSFVIILTHPDLAYSVHQCARFYVDPNAGHEAAVIHIVKYLLSTRKKLGKENPKYGLNMKPDISQGFEAFVDASFIRDYDRSWDEEPTLILSRTGFTIKYVHCQIL
eukprot:5613263-Ditylum_brightwellii.AAC.1